VSHAGTLAQVPAGPGEEELIARAARGRGEARVGFAGARGDGNVPP
jgi:hypothetical protein